jgi:hypothetical protein
MLTQLPRSVHLSKGLFGLRADIDIRIVRGEGDLDPAMPSFVTSYLRHIWSRAT